jgi:hypothetical protein
MRFPEFATQPPSAKDRLRTCTLYIPKGRFPDLTACRLAHGRPTRIVGVRALAPAWGGCSIDLMCDTPEAALDLMVAWMDSGDRSRGAALDEKEIGGYFRR